MSTTCLAVDLDTDDIPTPLCGKNRTAEHCICDECCDRMYPIYGLQASVDQKVKSTTCLACVVVFFARRASGELPEHLKDLSLDLCE